MKVGLLGAGYILAAHAKALKAVVGAELHAVCDISRLRAEASAKAFGIPHIFTDLGELLASACDVVHVLLPPHLHLDATRRIIEAGKSAFVEKPMGLDVAECESLVALAAARGLSLGVNHNFLFMPAYEELRQAARDGTLGKLDHVSIDWLYGLGLLQFGPYQNWMLSEEGNLFLEIGPHLAAFAIDLCGPLTNLYARASMPIDMPGEQRAWRHWNIVAAHADTAVALNLSVVPGQACRRVFVRGHAGSATLDFERGVVVREHTVSTSTVFDPFLTGVGSARSVFGQAARNLVRNVTGTLRKTPQANGFEESVFRSIAAFYSGLGGNPDARVSGSFGVEVMRLCRSVVDASSVATGRVRVDSAAIALAPPATVLVVGGTGFIGKRLVQALVKRGVGVRVLSRSASAARLELGALPVEVAQGSHGDSAVLERALAGIEVVYHLAKATGKRWEDYVQNDVEPTRVLAEAALARGIKRFIYTGTIDSYASAAASDTIDGDTALDPRIVERNLYARSKATCEVLLLEMHAKRGLPLVIFRPGVVIGVGSPPAHWGVGMFHSDTRVQFWGDGTTKLPLVLVEDVAEGLALGMSVPGIEGKAFLLTDAPLLNAREYVAATSQALGSRISALPTPIWRFYLLDAVKEAAKRLIQHPNHRGASYHDWNCRSHRARYDNEASRRVLGWTPAGNRDDLIAKGIVGAVRHYMR